MKKIVAVIIGGVVLASCGSHPCPAYTSDNYENSKKVEKNYPSESIDFKRIGEI